MPEWSYWSKSSISTIAPLKVIWGNALRECIALKWHTGRNGKWPMAHCVQCKAPIFWSIFEMPQLLTGTPDLRSWRCREPEIFSHCIFLPLSTIVSQSRTYDRHNWLYIQIYIITSWKNKWSNTSPTICQWYCNYESINTKPGTARLIFVWEYRVAD